MSNCFGYNRVQNAMTSHNFITMDKSAFPGTENMQFTVVSVIGWLIFYLKQ